MSVSVQRQELTKRRSALDIHAQRDIYKIR